MKILNNFLRTPNNGELNYKKLMFFNFLCILVIIILQITLIIYYVNIVPLSLSIINFASLSIYIFISTYITAKLQATSKNLEVEKNYNESLTYLYDSVKAFKHDFDNMVFVIGGFIKNKDIDKLSIYYNNLAKDCERVNNLALLNPSLINDSGIYNLLITKYKSANEYKIDIKLEYFFDLQKLHMPIYDFSRVLGILLDNALEAAKDSIEKQVNLIFRDSQKNRTQIISIENSYNNKNIDTSEIFEKGKTSKENHSGMGLWEVKQILSRNSNVNLITTNNDEYFKQTLEIYY